MKLPHPTGLILPSHMVPYSLDVSISSYSIEANQQLSDQCSSLHCTIHVSKHLHELWTEDSLQGVLTLQSYIYYERYPEDPKHLRAFVSQFAHTVFCNTDMTLSLGRISLVSNFTTELSQKHSHSLQGHGCHTSRFDRSSNILLPSL